MRYGINSVTSTRNLSEKATLVKASYPKESDLVAERFQWMKLDAKLVLLPNSEGYSPKTPGKSSVGLLFFVEPIYASSVPMLLSGVLRLRQDVLLAQTEAPNLPKRHLEMASGPRPRRMTQTSGLSWKLSLN
jgi:hypothetical protein